MLPTMQALKGSRTGHVVRVGPLRLFFSFYHLIAFQVDGEPPTVSVNCHGRQTTEKHLKVIEPDGTKWVTDQEFAKRWLVASRAIHRLEIAGKTTMRR
jgi:hypothetical protein